jgi:hypothetical protein
LYCVYELCTAYKAKQKAVKNCQQSRLKSRSKKLSTNSSKNPQQKNCQQSRLKSRCKKLSTKSSKKPPQKNCQQSHKKSSKKLPQKIVNKAAIYKMHRAVV